MNHELKQSDIIIMGTDGLWDNVFDKDIHNCIKSNSTNLQLI
jgi:serine/threonine protein phosphatase PrpC